MRSLLFICLFALCAAAHAQLRTIPGEAKRGEMRHLQDMVVSIDGVQRRLAPGAQIRDTDNRIVVPASVASRARVRYLVDAQGLVHRVWLLTPAEAARDKATADKAAAKK